MVTCVKVHVTKAQDMKKELIANNQLDNNFFPKKIGEYIYFPVQQYKKETEDRELDPRLEKLTAIPFKDVLSKILTPKEMSIAKTAHDIMGTIAIIEVPKELVVKEQEIAESLMQSNPLIKTVLKKGSGHEGTFRTQEMKFVAGVETKEATYKENECVFTVNVEDVYFSSRLSTERKRIANQVKEDEEILVMFSGAAPYPCVISKITKAKNIVGVEINPEGHKYGLQNVAKNKLTNVELYCGDVREVVSTLNKTFDRIIMPLPKTAEEFLDITLPVAKKGCIIHMYGFYHVDEFDKAKQEVKKYCERLGRTYEILEIVKSGQQSPRTYRICVDFKVTN